MKTPPGEHVRGSAVSYVSQPESACRSWQIILTTDTSALKDLDHLI